MPNNALTGTVPETISQLTNLRRLFLRNNDGLFGTMPDHTATDTDTLNGTFLGEFPPTVPSLSPIVNQDNPEEIELPLLSVKEYLLSMGVVLFCLSVATSFLVRAQRKLSAIKPRIVIKRISL